MILLVHKYLFKVDRYKHIYGFYSFIGLFSLFISAYGSANFFCLGACPAASSSSKIVVLFIKLSFFTRTKAGSINWLNFSFL